MSNILRAFLLTPEDLNKFKHLEGVKYVINRHFEDMEAANHLKGFLMSLNYPMSEKQLEIIGEIHEEYKNIWAEHVFSEEEADILCNEDSDLRLNYAYITKDELVLCKHTVGSKDQFIDSPSVYDDLNISVVSVLLDILAFYDYIVRMNIRDHDYFTDLAETFLKSFRDPRYTVYLNGAHCKEGVPYNFKIVENNNFNVYYFDQFTTGDHSEFYGELANVLHYDSKLVRFESNADVKFRQTPIDALPSITFPVHNLITRFLNLKPKHYTR